jgi:heme A synthase
MSNFAKYAWFVTIYNVGVILWGAVVRATGSGAGCGNHWPACNGQIIPYPKSIETLIEFGHRVSSSFSGVLVIILLIWAFRLTLEHRQKFVRWMTVLSFIFIIIEGGLGAALVRFEWVADNASVERAYVVALHLANTLILLTFMTLTAWGASHDEALHSNRDRNIRIGLIVSLLAYMFLSAIGAVTALGDTLFPAESLAHGLQQDFDSSLSFLVRLRIWHPVVAIIVSAYLYAFAYYLLKHYEHEQVERLVMLMFMTIALQVGGGFLNVILLAPTWMQIVHLLLADTLWIILVILSVTVLTSNNVKS